MSTETLAQPLQRLLHRERAGMLSTLSLHAAGYPFGTVTPYAPGPRGEVILVISDLAEHTKNLKADPRASLLVTERACWDDPQSGARVTLVGTVTRITDPAAVAAARARWDARMPAGRRQLDTPDFGTWCLTVEQVRFIGGFGVIRWMPARDLLVDPTRDPLADVAADIVQHMNQDHPDALGLYLQAFRSVTATDARMVSVDRWGFDVTAGDRPYRVDFSEPATTPDAVRGELVALVRAARAALATPTAPDPSDG